MSAVVEAVEEAVVGPRRPVDLVVEGLRYGYRRRRRIIDDLDLQVAPGSVCTLSGPSGCGKSTVLYLVGLMLTPWSGAVRYGGRDVASARDAVRSARRAADVGFVFQDAILDAGASVRANLHEAVLVQRGRVGDADRARAADLLEAFGVELSPRARCGEVSGGQAQRIALCRALVCQPGLVLADEPTGNLDAASKDVVLAGLQAYAAAGGTVVVVTHDPSVFAIGDVQVRLGPVA